MRPRMGQDRRPNEKGGWQRPIWLALGGLVLAPVQAFAAALDVQTWQFGNAVVLSALALGGVGLAIAAGLWALAEQRAAQQLRRALRATLAKTKALLSERDALLAAGRESLLVWPCEGASPLSYGGADEVLSACLAGRDGPALSAALEGLSKGGAGFQLRLHDKNGRAFLARGRAVGSMAALWFEEFAFVDQGADYRAILNALPVPVWLRDKTLCLNWANLAFLKQTGAKDLEAACREQVSLDKAELDLAAAARTQNSLQRARRFCVVNGQRRAIAFSEIPIGDGAVIGTAIDVSDLAAAEAQLQLHVDAHADTLDKLQTAVAIFAKDQKLTFYNQAFAQLWGLAESWLDKHPSDGEILDWLRDARKLPEQRDYQKWKRSRLGLYGETARQKSNEENWYLPNGQTIRVLAQPHPFGGLTFLYEDVTQRLALESDYRTLMKVQSATLDALSEAVAVFGPHGKLKLHNAAFAKIWDLENEELKAEPHIRALAELGKEKFADSQSWDRLVQAVVSGTSQHQELGQMHRSDRTILSVNLLPLPDGATLVTFADVTDRFRIEGALRERNEGLEAADRLKSDFIKHVSYELRTPLNTILGFSEHLASGVPGPLNAQQEEYVHAIVAGGNTLKSLVNDILDLALVESGALRLELEQIDLHELLSDIASHARDWASKVGLHLELDCPAQAGAFLADSRRLRQVLFNLMSNAFKFTQRGGTITLSGRILGEDVQISVADNGPGISADVKANVFERFSSKSQAGQRAGPGLGLALVNRFLELHNGWVEIETNHGTLVRCHLPRHLAADEPTQDLAGARKHAYL